jgi:hypothetical protein
LLQYSVWKIKGTVAKFLMATFTCRSPYCLFYEWSLRFSMVRALDLPLFIYPSSMMLVNTHPEFLAMNAAPGSMA